MNRILYVCAIFMALNMCLGFRYQSSCRPKQCLACITTFRLYSSEETPGSEDSSSDLNDGSTVDKKLFDMNQRTRLGRSKDQEGKSNIWSIEPTMEVAEEEGESQVKKNLVVGGIVIGAALASLPLFLAFSRLLPGAKH